MDIKQLKEIMAIFESSSLSELEIEEKGIRFKLTKKISQESTQSISLKVKEKPSRKEVLEEKKKEEEKKEKKLVSVSSPLVGTLYRSPSPEESPFVEVGDEVKPGQTLCVIEAMKVMNEIISEVKGRVSKILVENGQPVEYGQELFLLEE